MIVLCHYLILNNMHQIYLRLAMLARIFYCIFISIFISLFLDGILMYVSTLIRSIHFYILKNDQMCQCTTICVLMMLMNSIGPFLFKLIFIVFLIKLKSIKSN